MKRALCAITFTIIVLLMVSSAFALTYGEEVFFEGKPWGKSAQAIIDAEGTTKYTDKTIGEIREIGFKADKNIDYQYYFLDDKLVAGVISGAFTGNKKEKEQRYQILMRNCGIRFGSEWALSKKEISTALSDCAKIWGLPKSVSNINKYSKLQTAWYSDDCTAYICVSNKYECKMIFIANPDSIDEKSTADVVVTDGVIVPQDSKEKAAESSDFRGLFWGASRSDIESKEGRKHRIYQGTNCEYVYYKLERNGYKYDLCYMLVEDSLFGARYDVMHLDRDDFNAYLDKELGDHEEGDLDEFVNILAKYQIRNLSV